MASSWHSYPSIYSMGHRAVKELLLDPVLVQEKVDGSQFSFGRFDTPDGPVLRCRSKGAQIQVDAPDKMFAKAVDYVKSVGLFLVPGWTYRGEFLAKPKHNTLLYDRVPKNHIVIFDINSNEEEYLSDAIVKKEAERLDLETVPIFYSGVVETLDQFRALLAHESFLGGQKIEGVVVKNYARFGPDKKALMGKFVSEHFKECHAKEWKVGNPTKADVVAKLIETLKTPARWEKAVQHLREAGRLTDSPQDIGLLFKEVPADIEKEEIEFIKEKLYDWAKAQIMRGVTAGLPEWYKEKLLALQFEKKDTVLS